MTNIGSSFHTQVTHLTLSPCGRSASSQHSSQAESTYYKYIKLIYNSKDYCLYHEHHHILSVMGSLTHQTSFYPSRSLFLHFNRPLSPRPISVCLQNNSCEDIRQKITIAGKVTKRVH